MSGNAEYEDGMMITMKSSGGIVSKQPDGPPNEAEARHRAEIGSSQVNIVKHFSLKC